MRLSEAIRVGSKNTVKIKGVYVDQKNGACALGAAGLASNIPLMMIGMSRLESEFPILLKTGYLPNAILKKKLRSIIIVLNDRCDWSRERISDWIEREFENQATLVTQKKDEKTYEVKPVEVKI